MKYKENWSESAVRFTKWWNGEKMDRPLLWIVAKKERFDEEPEKSYLRIMKLNFI
ncbi:MAG: hypothetical protein GX800_02240 [Clostridiaceae bacterium]|nr:hypothetical protein [Clostridiaceae bacterium]